MVKNISAVTVEKCQLKLVDMVNVNEEPTRHKNKPFKSSQHNPLDPLNTKLPYEFDIPPGDYAEFDIVQCDENDPDPKVLMCYATQGQLDAFATTNVISHTVCPHILSIKAVAANNPEPIQKTFKFWFDNEGILKIEEAEWPLENT